ncbi:kinase-like protein [Clathrospora elynae]|uniref:Kinase-like protein n=1 Tax=Clathrospora elynae TaxID=706981 RepID=A0A6A5S5D7_9PLEO|nr:kinase-like protein [Clathrospora elynae]
MNPPPGGAKPETDVGRDYVVIHQISGCNVTLLADSTVIKAGRWVTLDEPPALALAAKHGLPVPRLYDVGQVPSGENYIRMNFIEGEKLDVVWPGMTAEEKDSICRQLREVLTTMRSIPSENGLIGSCSGGNVRDTRQYTQYTGGPYKDEATFNSEFYFDLVKTTPVPIRTALFQQIRSDHRIVFSHGDLAQHNILVKDGRITLVDWDTAGWYPEHWDYLKFFERSCKHEDWKNRAKDIFPQIYDNELAYHQAIIRWQRP